MRRKWFIIAAVIFLGVACGILLLINQSGYSYNAVKAELAKHGVYPVLIMESRIKMPVFRTRAYPLGLDKLINWYRYDFFTNRDIPPPQIFMNKSGSTYILLSSKRNRVHEVEFMYTTDETLKLKSELSQEFPDLSFKFSELIELKKYFYE